MTDITTEQPIWFDLDYITKILKTHTKDQLKDVKSYSVKPATTKGENYFSILYLIEVEYTTAESDAKTASHNESFIMKTRLESEIFAQVEESFDVFTREVQYYTVIREEMTKLMESIGDKTVLGPRGIYADDRIIVMENLKNKNYDIKNVKEGLNFQQCQLVLEKLAKFHALSMILYKKNPDMFRYHLPGNISEHPSPLHEMYTKAIYSTVEYCKSQEDLKQYADSLENFGNRIIAKMINVFSRSFSDRFHVLNHGDIWVNNLMFLEAAERNDDADVLFIDFQEGFFGSPGIDWNYFIFSSWQQEVFKNNFDDLIVVYHQSLCDILNKLNYQQRIPTVEDVRREVINKGFHGLATATCLLPILINEHSDLTDPENFVTDTEEATANRRIIFNNPKFGERLNVFLKYFVDNTLL